MVRTHLQLQKWDVEELMQVLQAKAVLHGRLSIAEIRGAWRSVFKQRYKRKVLAGQHGSAPSCAKDHI
jgi:hypothetical protein